MFPAYYLVTVSYLITVLLSSFLSLMLFLSVNGLLSICYLCFCLLFGHSRITGISSAFSYSLHVIAELFGFPAVISFGQSLIGQNLSNDRLIPMLVCFLKVHCLFNCMYCTNLT